MRTSDGKLRWKVKEKECEEGHAFKKSLRRPAPVVRWAKRGRPLTREVEPFTPAVYQNNVVLRRLPRGPPLFSDHTQVSLFRRLYDNRRIPVQVDHNAVGLRMKWNVSLADIDYRVYLPIFCEGLLELDYPYKFLARQGVSDMLFNSRGRVLETLPQVVLTLKKVMQSRIKEVIIGALMVLQHMVLSDVRIGRALVPYYRILLPILFRYKEIHGETSVEPERKETIGSIINTTLELLEEYGGPTALINIKYSVPTYQSNR